MTDRDVRGATHFEVRLPYEAAAATTARRLLRQFLTRHAAREELVGDATLVLHELVINGLIHGEPDEKNQIEISGHLSGGRLTISVRDHGIGGTVAARPLTQEGLNGRGLAMVSMLSDSWSVDRTSGTRVSAQLSV